MPHKLWRLASFLDSANVYPESVTVDQSSGTFFVGSVKEGKRHLLSPHGSGDRSKLRDEYGILPLNGQGKLKFPSCSLKKYIECYSARSHVLRRRVCSFAPGFILPSTLSKQLLQTP